MVATPATEAVEVRPLPRLGLSLATLGLFRAYPDGFELLRFLRQEPTLLVTAPASFPWADFPGVLWAAWPVLLGLAVARWRSPRLLKAVTLAALAMGLERALFVGV